MTSRLTSDEQARIMELTKEAQMHKDMGNKFGMYACIREITSIGAKA